MTSKPMTTGRLLAGMLALTVLAGEVPAQAFTAVIQPPATTVWSHSFVKGGLGTFVPGGLVSVGAGVRLFGSPLASDGVLTSGSLGTAGFTDIQLHVVRACAAGLAQGEGLALDYAVNGGAFAPLDLPRATTWQTSATVALPASAANATLKLRFRMLGNAATDHCTVQSATLTGTAAPMSSAMPAIGPYTTFESGQVRPLALSPDGKRLYAVNTPDNRVEVFDVSAARPVLLESVPVGLEPVALALAPDGRLWVVNHLSDSVSIVDLSSRPARVVNTLWVGDEPRDIVFAGPGSRRAFITAAHRGQNVPFDPALSTAGVGRADVWVFDTESQGMAPGGTPLTVLNMFGDTLRALARNASGDRVYAAVFNSGNRSTVLADEGGSADAISKPPPWTSSDGVRQPRTGLIVQKNMSGDWVDSGDPRTNTPAGKWNHRVKLDLPDYDVFTIDAGGSTPRVVDRTSGVGTTLFNMVVNPSSGKLYVSNQEARNLIRFEGPGTRSTTVRGHFVTSRITVVAGGQVWPRHLNKHITSYEAAVGTPAEKAAALAIPLEMAISPDGSQLFLAAMGSDKLARIGTAALESDSFTPSAADHVRLSGGGPTGVVLDAPRNRAFVLTRFDNGISVVNTTAWAEAAHVRMHNPEPAEVVMGRRFLYDARLTSSRGDSSCAGCHIFGDMDHLAWDLGNPDGTVQRNPNPFTDNSPGGPDSSTFHPMKGPMTTQSLRGMLGNGPMHWRGDRTGQEGLLQGGTVEERAFHEFNAAFTDLLGRERPLTDEQMGRFTRFALSLVYPPNPIARLDNALTDDQSNGLLIYNTAQSTPLGNCNSCHTLDIHKKHFGTEGLTSFEGSTIPEHFKVPHLRNLYQKVGMFASNASRENTGHMGPQIRGFGFDRAGIMGTVQAFLRNPVFSLDERERVDLEQMVLAMPSELAPIVGQQLTVTPLNAGQADVKARLSLLVQRAMVMTPRPECELVAKGVIGDEARGWVMNRSQGFVPDRASDPAVSLTALLTQFSGAGSPVTFTCVPPGSGTRIGIDRDANRVLDRM